MHGQCIAAVEQNVVAVPGIERHEIFSASYHRRPTCYPVTKLKEDVVGQRVEIVPAIRVIRESFHDDGEEWVKGAECGIAVCGHLLFSGSSRFSCMLSARLRRTHLYRRT